MICSYVCRLFKGSPFETICQCPQGRGGIRCMVNHEGSRGTIGWAGFQPGHDYSDSAACALRRVLIGMVTLSHISSTRLNTHSH